MPKRLDEGDAKVYSGHSKDTGFHKKNPGISNRKRPASLTPDGVSSTFSEGLDSPPKKKHKKTPSEDADALLARRLQEEENGRARTTRGGGVKRKPVAKKEKKVKKSKSKTKVDSDDDSDVHDGSGSKKEVNRNSGFHVSGFSPTPASINPAN